MDRSRLRTLNERERARFAAEHPESRRLHEQALGSLLDGVPMSWMAKWPGGHPVYLASAKGARVVDVDGREYVDLCLGDTAAMAGHSPPAVTAAVARRLGESGGATAMLPTADAAWVAEELGRRFGVPYWSFTLTATDANRFAIRMCREITGRPRILVFSWCYHGTVDETFIVLDEQGDPRSRAGNVGPAVDPTETTRVCEFNDTEALARLLHAGDVACVLAEPALTNIGIVPPQPGFHDRLRELCTETGTLLIIDETHTLSAGPGGCTAAWGLQPDLVTLGKSIGGGIPIGAFGVSAAVAERIAAQEDADYVDTGGVGGTLAGSALSLAAARATLEEVLTEAAFERMVALGARFAAGAREAIERSGAPWCVVELGARAEYRFTPQVPRTGGESEAAGDEELEEYLHLALANRGVLITPFHNMALMCPATTEADVDRHTAVFGELVEELFR